jgi:hypothetical protein
LRTNVLGEVADGKGGNKNMLCGSRVLL